VDAVLEAMSELPNLRLLLVGQGPDEARLRRLAPPNCAFVGSLCEAELRWCYANCLCLVSAAAEDLGLAALEAMAFGRPVAVIRAGGFLETVRSGDTGVFFETPTPVQIAEALRAVACSTWDTERIAKHAGGFSEEQFQQRLLDIAARFTSLELN
jgi:glycosyltransferase involved in cell wall biosynthesis